jgi:predicted ATPase
MEHLRDDPVEALARTIEMSQGQSIQILTGPRGTGKSTELRRLQKLLRGAGHTVVRVDLLQRLGDLRSSFYADFDRPLSPLDSTSKKDRLGLIDLLLQGDFAGNLRDLLNCIVNALSELPSPTVILIDSLEHAISTAQIRKTDPVSVETIYLTHTQDLAPLGAHLVYTALPSFKIYAGDVSRPVWDSVQSITPIKTQTIAGELYEPGLATLAQVVGRRSGGGGGGGGGDDDEQHRLTVPSVLDPIALASGGVLRDLLRILRELLRGSSTLPLDMSSVEPVLHRMRDGSQFLSSRDLSYLSHVAKHQTLPLVSVNERPHIARLLDTNLVLCYRNGSEWYDVHPLLKSDVLRRMHEAPSPLAVEQLPSEVATGLIPVTAAKPTRATVSSAAPVTLSPEMRITLVVENYRALRRVRWTLPRGVSALVGPNGSGKSTLLDVPDLLRHVLEHDVRKAIDDRGGPGTLRNLRVDRNATVAIGIEVDTLLWRLDLSPRGAALPPLTGEVATLDGVTIFDRSAPPTGLIVRADDSRSLLHRFAERPDGDILRPVVTLLETYRLYANYDLASIRVHGSQISSDEYLHPDGRNVFSVLRNWRDRKETRPRWEFVIASLRDAFPDTFEDLDFDMAGQTVSGRVVAPQPDMRIPTYFAAQGWLVALLHLCAVASAEPAGAVAIDEFENSLHPFAIRSLVDAMRRWAEQTGISVVLATHSPVVLDQFKDQPDHLYVMEPGREPTPLRLDELHDPEWLAHFSLGDLYSHDEFGAQRRES